MPLRKRSAWTGISLVSFFRQGSWPRRASPTMRRRRDDSGRSASGAGIHPLTQDSPSAKLPPCRSTNTAAPLAAPSSSAWFGEGSRSPAPAAPALNSSGFCPCRRARHRLGSSRITVAWVRRLAAAAEVGANRTRTDHPAGSPARAFGPNTFHPQEDDATLLWAAVSIVLAPNPDSLLLIRRAERTGDPWGGHMALPGGRRGDAGRGSPGHGHSRVR